MRAVVSPSGDAQGGPQNSTRRAKRAALQTQVDRRAALLAGPTRQGRIQPRNTAFCGRWLSRTNALYGLSYAARVAYSCISNTNRIILRIYIILNAFFTLIFI